MQLAAPFYGVMMLECLEVDSSTLMLRTAFATLATIVMMKTGGPSPTPWETNPLFWPQDGS